MTKTNLLPDEIEVYHDKFGDLLAFKEFDLRVPGTRYVRADLVSTTNKPAEVDPEVLQALQFLTVGAEDSYDPDHVKVAAKMIKDALSGHLATGKGGGAAPTQIDAGDLELALSSLEPDDVDKAVIYAAARAHLSKLSGGE